MSTHPFNDAELHTWDAIGEVLSRIENLDERGPLTYNEEELAAGVHVLQQFVLQHMLYRLWPMEFSDWWEQEDEDDCDCDVCRTDDDERYPA